MVLNDLHFLSEGEVCPWITILQAFVLSKVIKNQTVNNFLLTD